MWGFSTLQRSTEEKKVKKRIKELRRSQTFRQLTRPASAVVMLRKGTTGGSTSGEDGAGASLLARPSVMTSLGGGGGGEA